MSLPHQHIATFPLTPFRTRTMKELDIFSRHQTRKPAGIEHVQPRKCCAFPHEGCTPSQEHKEYVQKTEEKKGFWQRKLEELQGKGRKNS